MPNHVQHVMELTGPSEQIVALLNHIKGEKDIDLFDFNNVIPMPDVLKDSTADGNTNAELVSITGYSDWYDWCCDNWGTKWGAYDTILTDDGKLLFQTAWSTAPNVFAKLSELFPEVKMVIDYADEDIGSNVGQLTYLGGMLTTEIVGGAEMACAIWGYDYDKDTDQAIYE